MVLQLKLHEQQQQWLTLAAGAVLRLALFALTSLPSKLQHRPELVSPLTTFRSLSEGVFLYKHDTNPYDGGVFHQSPIYLGLFSFFIPVTSPSFTALLWVFADLASAVFVSEIWLSRKPLGKEDHRKTLLVAWSLFNPYGLLTCLARSTSTLDNTLLLMAISRVASGKTYTAGILLGLSMHTSLYPVLLLPAFLMLSTATKQRAVQLIVFFSAIILPALASTSAFSTVWLRQTWGSILAVPDLTPNVGMWWYFFTEIFDHFRHFFLGVFQLHIVIYVAPICLRFRHDPLIAILVLAGVLGTWKSYPTLGDTAVWACLLGCFPEIVSNLRHPLFTLTVHLYTSILLPLLHSLWLLTGTGNANFFYAATMVYGLNASLAIVDVVGAAMRARVKDEVQKSVESVAEQDRHGRDAFWESQDWAIVQLTGPDI
ncbi:putative cell division cycle protein 91 [Naematelia encephala]|uniref:Putative cell division cycle protein 91 n=1 Tax=Naematelia encephala TaxID=71784 RepID=A0A1Y2BDC8_9TREE|nr:putative cell division cycle protein 91 [Naematelia encephala]